MGIDGRNSAEVLQTTPRDIGATRQARKGLITTVKNTQWEIKEASTSVVTLTMVIDKRSNHRQFDEDGGYMVVRSLLAIQNRIDYSSNEVINTFNHIERIS